MIKRDVLDKFYTNYSGWRSNPILTKTGPGWIVQTILSRLCASLSDRTTQTLTLSSRILRVESENDEAWMHAAAFH